MKMLRMRARRKLTALLETASASGALALLRLRRMLGFEQLLWARATATSDESGVISIGASLIAALAIGVVPAGSGLAGPPREPVVTQDVRSVDSLDPGDTTATTTTAAAYGVDEVAALRRTTRDARLARNQKAARRAGHGNRSGHSHRSNERGFQPVRVSVPGGFGYVEAGARATLWGIGGGTGKSKAGTPVCVQGTGQSMTGLECAQKTPGTGAKLNGTVEVLGKRLEAGTEVK
jgi:hypothetical protein